jgi:DNA repair exonuclease SbcCD ATPase subunit
MITLLKLKWSNCFSYGANNELDLSDNSVTQVIGTNGMGKSSIPLIIEEAIFNKNSKGIKKADIPNRYINNGYHIYLSFQKDEDLYEVEVDRKTNIKVHLYKNGEDISSHTATNTYKTIQDIVGLDFKTFSQLVYQNTNTSLQFLTATDTNRKKFLIDLLHLEKYVELFEVFKDEVKAASQKITMLESTSVTIEKWLKDNKLSSTTILPMLDLEIDTEDDEKLLRSLTIELETISETNRKILANNQYKQMLAGINLAAIQSIEATQLLSYDSLQAEKGSLEMAILNANKMIAKLRKLGHHCPTCEQDIDDSFLQELISKEETIVQASQERLDNEINAEIEKIKTNNSEFHRRAKMQKEWEELYRSIDSSLPSEILDKNSIESRMSLVRDRLRQAKEEIAKIAAENEKRTRQNTRIQVIQEQTEKFQAELDTNKQLLAEEQAMLANLETLKKAFSTNGLLAYKIENLVGELEELTNHYLGELSDGRFTLEFVVTNDKLNVEITDNGKVIDIQALSSGELARVNTATLIAIRRLMSSISKSQINVLFLDEVVSVLDDQGREKLVEVLLGEDLNTYIVSHGWSHPLLAKIEVVKDDNISRLDK